MRRIHAAFLVAWIISTWSLPALPAHAAEPPTLVGISSDNVQITTSCMIRMDAAWIEDAEGNGVIHVTGDDIEIDFLGQRLHGATEDTPPNQFSGIGLRVSGSNVTIRNLLVSGFKAGVLASDADGLTMTNCDVSNNFRQELRSTPWREDPTDWLRPHANDERQWLDQYGAGIYIERSRGVSISGVRCRQGQNGIILDRVQEARIIGNDCSFLSGWGLALWRSSDNLIARNAFDFCVRGYSHGVYNRGQDSAGILFFEQCSDNTVVENSATHCGDGFFGFAGQEALGETDPKDDPSWYLRRGNNRNILRGNNFSYAVAHGIEMTFSFDNHFWNNKLHGNAICGIWGGYSRDTVIFSNSFQNNGEMPYGSERGGINIEHGRGNVIVNNTFANDACGVFLWWDEDAHLSKLPWSRANGVASTSNVIVDNGFRSLDTAIQLRQSDDTIVLRSNTARVNKLVDADDQSSESLKRQDTRQWQPTLPRPIPSYDAPAVTAARTRLAGRKRIIMTQWGPHDWESPLLHLVERSPRHQVYQLLGDAARQVELSGDPLAELDWQPGSGRITVTTAASNRLVPFDLQVHGESSSHQIQSTLTPITWSVRFLASNVDPRIDVMAWRETEQFIDIELPHLSLHYGHGGPSELKLDERVTAFGFPKDGFGTKATATIQIPPGTWRLRALSDDGFRVTMNRGLVLHSWQWQPPTEFSHRFFAKDAMEVTLVAEHFELDGYSVFELDFERVR